MKAKMAWANERDAAENVRSMARMPMRSIKAPRNGEAMAESVYGIERYESAVRVS